MLIEMKVIEAVKGLRLLLVLIEVKAIEAMKDEGVVNVDRYEGD